MTRHVHPPQRTPYKPQSSELAPGLCLHRSAALAMSRQRCSWVTTAQGGRASGALLDEQHRFGRSAHFPFFSWDPIYAVLLYVVGWLVWPLQGEAQATDNELRVANRDWNGLSKLAQEAGAIGVRLSQTNAIDLVTANSDDGLLIVHPTRPLPRRALTSFMHRGGRIALLDDFGTGQDLLSVFHVRRSALDLAIPTPHLRQGRDFAIATPLGEHPLASGVQALVTDHPQVLHHPQLDAIFALGEKGQALALSGAVGEGRLVAVGDSSVLINNLLAYPDNRRFARNLIRYLAGEHHGKVFLMTGDAVFEDASEAAGPKDPIAMMRQSLRELAERPPNPTAVYIAVWTLALGLLVAAMTALPQRSAYEHLRNRAASSSSQTDSRTTHADSLLRYDHELRSALEHTLRLPSGAGRTTMVEAIRKHAGPSVAQKADNLLKTLELHRTRPLTTAAIRVTGRRFRKLVSEGERIVKALLDSPV